MKIRKFSFFDLMFIGVIRHMIMMVVWVIRYIIIMVMWG